MNYRVILAGELAQRKGKNQLYSLNAFARSLGLSPASLSQLLNGKRPISRKSMQKILARGEFSPQKEKSFRESAQKELIQGQEGDLEFSLLALDQFKLIAEWHHFALLALFKLSDMDCEHSALAARLGVSTAEIEASCQRLVRLKLLTYQDGKYLRTTHPLFAEAPQGDAYIKRHHEQMIQKALNSLDHHSPAERDITSATLAFAQSDLAKARELIKNLRNDLERLSQQAPVKDRVYQANIQFFPLDQVLSESAPVNLRKAQSYKGRPIAATIIAK